MSRPEARRRQQQASAHQIADGLAEFFDATDTGFVPELDEPPITEPAYVRGARRAFAFPVVAVSVFAVIGGLVWGVLSGRRH